MTTEFQRLSEELVSSSTALPVKSRGLFLLAYSQRLLKLFELYEERLPVPPRKRLADLLDDLWSLAAGAAQRKSLANELDEAIPGEEWVTDGFHDAVAQYVGGLAKGALQGLSNKGAIHRRPEAAVLGLLRLLLSEMRLGCSEPGDDAESRSFEATLHRESIVSAEAEMWRQLIGRISASEPSEILKGWAQTHAFDVNALEPELSQGLALDGIPTRSRQVPG